MEVFSGGGVVASFIGLFRDSLWVELNHGGFGFWGSYGGMIRQGWKSLAWKAVEEGGSPATNMRTFLDDLGK
ncbi:hypothetical protein VNO77_03522 [Canavalia gladiata]|uniref:Uncharacterized protein n=1 Tax=Canavalia gladiata TaxID=3824 RepID=A0AAN9R6X1_CANGL